MLRVWYAYTQFKVIYADTFNYHIDSFRQYIKISIFEEICWLFIIIAKPEQNILKSIEILSKIKTNKEFKNIKIIDLRISKNIIITYE